jgi:DNA invertase Pin-like site-specific DNA recombinase
MQMATNDFIAYYRVSTRKQGKSGLGLSAQREAVARYLNSAEGRVIAEFTEVESGKRSERPELERALAACRLRRVPLVVAKVDRLTRSVAFLSRLLEAGVDVRFADLPAIEGAAGRFMLQQMAAVAELEAGFISERTKRALAAAKAKGKRLGGYRGGKLTGQVRLAGTKALTMQADARASDVAPIIAELNNAGVRSLAGIAHALSERGIPTSRGGNRWTATQVGRTVRRLRLETSS